MFFPTLEKYESVVDEDENTVYIMNYENYDHFSFDKKTGQKKFIWNIFNVRPSISKQCKLHSYVETEEFRERLLNGEFDGYFGVHVYKEELIPGYIRENRKS